MNCLVSFTFFHERILSTDVMQVIACSFLTDTEREICSAKTVENSASILSIPAQAGTTVTPVTFKCTAGSNMRSTTCRGSDDHQNVGGSGSSYILKSQAMHMVPPLSSIEWRGAFSLLKSISHVGIAFNGDISYLVWEFVFKILIFNTCKACNDSRVVLSRWL